MRVRTRRGVGLAWVLMVTAMAFMAVFVMAGLSTFHLRLAARNSNLQSARDLAESALAQALNNVLKNPQWGKSGETMRPKPGMVAEGSTYVVTFDNKVANAEGFLASKNNVAPEDEPPTAPLRWPPNPAFGQRQWDVPGNAVLMTSKATVHGVSATAITIVQFPDFPYAIASSGPVKAVGALQVTRSNPESNPQEALNKQTGRGSLATNSPAEKAVFLSPETLVTGNVEALGGIELNEATVEGALYPFSSSVGMPDIDLSILDPQDKPNHQVLTSYSGPLTGYNTIDGDATISGDMELNNAVVFVKGNLKIEGGGINGKGLVVVTGTTTIDGGGSMSAEDVAALISAGDVTLNGRGRDNSAFQGLVYTKGDLNASKITLVGAFVGNNQDPGGSQLKLESANAVHVPDYSRLTFDVDTSVTTPSTVIQPGTRNTGGYTMGIGLMSAIGTSQPVDLIVCQYVDDAGNKVYALANTNMDALPEAQFWTALGKYFKEEKGSRFDFPPGWENVYQYRSVNLGIQKPFTYFLQFADGKPGGKQPPRPDATPTPTATSTSTTTTEGKDKFSFDMNRFIDPAERARILFWQID